MKACSTILLINPSSGISGDMFSAALLSLLNEMKRQDVIELYVKYINTIFKSKEDSLISQKNVLRKGVSSLQIHFHPTEIKNHRFVPEITSIIKVNSATENQQKLSLNILHELVLAESKIHNKKPENLHLHEAGGEDSILDILSAAWLIDTLSSEMNLTEIYTAPIALASEGFISFSHGEVALPVPAVLEILKEYKVFFTQENKELVTPTGAAIIKGLQMKEVNKLTYLTTILANGYGAGSRDLTKRPNVLRASLMQIEK